VGAGWPLDGEVFAEGEQGDGGGARVPKRGEVTATGGPPVLVDVGVSGLFLLFTAIMWKVSRIEKLGNMYLIGSALGTSRHLG
jgi:hypothetical protein